MRVLLLEDHASSREPLAFLLEQQPDVDEVMQAGSVAEADRLVDRADLAVVDLGLPDGDGVVLIRAIRMVRPQARVLVLTGSRDRRDHARAIDAGAHEVLHKSAAIGQVLDAMRRLAAGAGLLSAAEAAEPSRLAARAQGAHDARSRAPFGRLTAREEDVLMALADGLTDKEIAERLQIGTETVRTHLARIFAKLGAESRLHALAVAVRLGLV